MNDTWIPTIGQLAAAINNLRDCGVTVSHSEGAGICALWNVGGMKRIGYFEVLRQAHRASLSSEPDASKRLLKPWPEMPGDAFK